MSGDQDKSGTVALSTERGSVTDTLKIGEYECECFAIDSNDCVCGIFKKNKNKIVKDVCWTCMDCINTPEHELYVCKDCGLKFMVRCFLKREFQEHMDCKCNHFGVERRKFSIFEEIVARNVEMRNSLFLAVGERLLANIYSFGRGNDVEGRLINSYVIRHDILRHRELMEIICYIITNNPVVENKLKVLCEFEFDDKRITPFYTNLVFNRDANNGRINNILFIHEERNNIRRKATVFSTITFNREQDETERFFKRILRLSGIYTQRTIGEVHVFSTRIKLAYEDFKIYTEENTRIWRRPLSEDVKLRYQIDHFNYCGSSAFVHIENERYRVAKSLYYDVVYVPRIAISDIHIHPIIGRNLKVLIALELLEEEIHERKLKWLYPLYFNELCKNVPMRRDKNLSVLDQFKKHEKKRMFDLYNFIVNHRTIRLAPRNNDITTFKYSLNEKSKIFSNFLSKFSGVDLKVDVVDKFHKKYFPLVHFPKLIKEVVLRLDWIDNDDYYSDLLECCMYDRNFAIELGGFIFKDYGQKDHPAYMDFYSMSGDFDAKMSRRSKITKDIEFRIVPDVKVDGIVVPYVLLNQFNREFAKLDKQRSREFRLLYGAGKFEELSFVFRKDFSLEIVRSVLEKNKMVSWRGLNIPRKESLTIIPLLERLPSDAFDSLKIGIFKHREDPYLYMIRKSSFKNFEDQMWNPSRAINEMINLLIACNPQIQEAHTYALKEDIKSIVDSKYTTLLFASIELVRQVMREERDFLSIFNVIMTIPFKVKFLEFFSCSAEEMARYLMNRPRIVVEDAEIIGELETEPQAVDENGVPVYMLDGEKEPFVTDIYGSFLSSIKVLLPSFIGKSAIFSEVAALILSVCSTIFFSSKAAFLKFLNENLHIEKISGSLDIVRFSTNIYYQFIYGLKEFHKTGNFEDFFLPTREDAFIRKARELLNSDYKVANGQVTRSARLFEIENVMDEGKRCTSIEAKRFLTSLHSKYNDERLFVDRSGYRTPAFPLFFMGPPGSGKTTAVESFTKTISCLEGNAFDVHRDRIVHPIKDPFVNNIRPDIKAFALNDVHDDYTNAATEKYKDIAQYIQEMVDTAELSLSGAAVEEKGVKIKPYVFTITSNFKSFKFATDPEKVKRRLAMGICAWVDFVKPGTNDKVLNDDINRLTEDQKKEYMRFTIMSVRTQDRIMAFDETPIVYNYRQFFNYFQRTYLGFKNSSAEYAKRFQDPSAVCACGQPNFLHYDKEGDNKVWKEFCELCVNKDVIMLNGDNLYDDPSLFDLYFWRLPYIQYCRLRIKRRYYKFKHMFDKDASTFTYEANKEEIEKLDHIIYSMDSYNAAYKYVELLLVLGLVALSGFGVYVACRKKDEVETCGKFNKKDCVIDEVSMQTTNDRTEITFTPDQLRDWGVKQNMINKADLISLKNVNDNDLVSIVRKNLVRLTIINDDEKYLYTQNGLIINDAYLIFNAHALLKEGKHVDISILVFKVKENTFTVSKDNFAIFEDICIVRHNLPGLHRNILKYMMEKDVEFQGGGTMVFHDRIRESKFEKGYRKLVHDGISEFLTSYEVSGSQDFQKGDCGGVLVAKTAVGSVIIGLFSYVTVDQKKSGFVSITKQVLNDMINKICDVSGEPIIRMFTIAKVEELTIVTPNQTELQSAPLSDNIQFLGHDSAYVGRTFRSSFKKTELYDTFVMKLKKEYDIPKRVKYNEVMPDGSKVFKTPLLRTFENINDEVYEDPNIFDKVFEVIKKRIDNVCVINGKLSPLTMKEAMIGCSEIGSTGIPFKTSCGPYWSKKGFKTKNDFFREKEDGTWSCDEELTEMVDYVYRELHEGNIIVPTGSDSIKDEIRPKEKTDVGSLRIFFCLDVHFNIVSAMILKPLVDLILSNPKVFCCYGQMNAVSNEWHSLYQYICRHSNFMELDFKKFDVSHSIGMFRFVGKIMRYLAIKSGYSVAAADVVYRVICSVSKVLHMYRGDLYMKYKGMISGWFLTLILNSISNLVIFIYVFEVLKDRLGVAGDFFTDVSLATTGDDAISSVSDRCNWFNMKSFEHVSKSLGYVVTDGQKGDIVDFYLLDNSLLTFLKRKFKVHKEMKTIVAPIDSDSIYKSLCWHGKIDITVEDRNAAAVENAQREAFLHGEDFFRELQRDLASVERGFKYKVLKYDSLIVEYQTKTFKVWDA